MFPVIDNRSAFVNALFLQPSAIFRLSPFLALILVVMMVVMVTGILILMIKIVDVVRSSYVIRNAVWRGMIFVVADVVRLIVSGHMG